MLCLDACVSLLSLSHSLHMPIDVIETDSIRNAVIRAIYRQLYVVNLPVCQPLEELLRVRCIQRK